MKNNKLFFKNMLTAAGWQRDVAIEIAADGMIATLVADSEKPDGAVEYSAPAVPAMANIHSHAHQRAMIGLGESSGPNADSFWTWREVMYGYAKVMTPEDLQAVAAQLYVETAKAGFSVIGEFQYLHHQPDGTPYDERAEMSLCCMAAAEQAGIAMTILPTLYRYGGFGGAPSVDGQRRFLNDANGYLEIVSSLAKQAVKRPNLDRFGISPHSLRASTAELLDEVIAGLDEHDRQAPIHIHIAEQVKEVDDCVAWSGARPVDYLLDHFTVNSRWCAIHATHMSEAETVRLARSGCIAGLCPTTEANLGDGIFNGDIWQRENGAIAIGSDSHISVSVAEDLRMLEYSQRLKHLARNVLAGGPNRSTGRSLFDAACVGGGAALNQPMGEIAVGKRADIVVLDENHPALIGRNGDQLLDGWIFAGGNSCVRDVFVGGEKVVEAGHHIKEQQILDDYRKALKRLDAKRV